LVALAAKEARVATAEEIAKAAAQKEAVQGQVTCAGGVTDGSCTASGLQRIQANIVNGPRTQTDGIDFYVDYAMELSGMQVNVGVEGSYTLGYKVDAYSVGGVQIVDSFEAAGFYNAGNGIRPIQDLKMRAHANMAFGSNMNLLAYVNYISDYDDRRKPDPLFLDVDPRVGIDSQTTMDLHFTTLLLDDDLSLTVSAINVTDEDPLRAYGDLMYDGYTHNPLGRLFKVGFKYGF
jgi:hypothetical protein